MSEWITFVPSEKNFIGMGDVRRLTFFSCQIAQMKHLFRIVSKDILDLHQSSLVWELYLGDTLQDVKLQVLLGQIWRKYILW